MLDVKWTDEQKNAILKKGSNILVAAAAGSGKTAVLVERIIRKIIDDKIDIDKILVVTFTNAAASEMRERILDAIYKKIEENPDDTNMQRQIVLLNKASICTIDSFCLDVIKNNFYEIDVSANTRVADSTEILLLKQEVLDDIFEEKYISGDKDFLKLIETYTKYNRDEELKDLILRIYTFIQASPFPEDWLNEKTKMLDLTGITNFSQTPWGEIISEYVENILENGILKLENIKGKMQRFPELEKYTQIIQDDIDRYSYIKENLSNWDEMVKAIQVEDKNRWAPNKKITNELKDEARKIRDSVKKEVKELQKIVNCASKNAIEDLTYMHGILEKLKDLILEFSTQFYQRKREKNIMDFNDMEHLALNILIKKDEDGKNIRTEVAKKYAQKFEEIAIDEYQDSNLVQEYILTSVSRENNIFMVGDVKQSIYKFRQARPQLFIEKYNKYKINPAEGENRKIQLFKNFRSRKNILDFTNLVFEKIMSRQLGDIDYNETEYLNLGAGFEDLPEQNLKTQIEIIDTKEDDDIWKEDEEEETEEVERIEDVVLEARFVANKIKELVETKYQVIAKEGKRDIKYKDITVLLRSITGIANIYEKEISELGIPVYSDSSGEYLQTIEIETIMSLLKIINNPMQDIPLVTVMRSPIGNFTDNELIEIRLNDRNSSFYEALAKTDTPKVHKFLELLETLRKDEQYMALDEWIWNIYIKTGYMNYVSLMPNGNLRVSNLKILFERAKQYEAASFKGLFNFINFIDKVKFNKEDLKSAKIIGENENVVRIMSIHKSKGLEFPVVILAGAGKEVNMQELNEKILLDQDLGFGPQYINSDRHIEFKTLAKQALTIKAKKEAVSEEMRVLYVALTRAKEKLIIVGKQKDVNKKMQQKSESLEIYAKDSPKIAPYLLEKSKSYLDWLELIYAKQGKNEIFEVNVYKKKDVIKGTKKEDIEQENINKKIKELASKGKSEKELEKISKKIEWQYSYNDLNGIPTKTSVTKIKEQAADTSKTIKITEKPKFLNNDLNEKLTNAQKGTLMHMCVQKMNEKQEYDLEKINNLINELQEKEIISPKEAEAINVDELLKYTSSDLWKALKNAKDIHKEQAFYINLKANSLYEIKEDENILVQGVIDLYFIDSEGKLILVDYKTDFVKDEQELIDKYKKQLELYKQALEQALAKNVDGVYLFSLYLNKMIEVFI